MAFPELLTGYTQQGSQTSDSTSWTLTYPTVVARGDLIMAVVTNDGTAGVSFPSGFAIVAAGQTAATAARITVGVKKALGTESGNFTATLTIAEQGVWVVFRITQWYGCCGTLTGGGGWGVSVGGGDGASGGIATGTSTAPNSTSADPTTWGTEDALWMALCGFDGAAVATGFPSGYTNTHTQTSGGANGAGHAMAFSQINAGSEDPGAFTLDASEEWGAWMMIIRGDNQPANYPKLVGLSHSSTGGTASANATVVLPDLIDPGDLMLILHRSSTSTAGHGYPAGWNELFDDNSDASANRTSLAWKSALGTEAGTTITITQDNIKFATIAMVFKGTTDPSKQPPQFSTLVTGTSTTPDPGTVTPTGGSKKYVWIWAGGWEGEQTSPPAAEPTNYTSKLGSNSGTAGAITTNVRVAVAFRWNEAASEDPGSWTISVSDDWTATAVAIHPASLVEERIRKGPLSLQAVQRGATW
jgi:hypothetical protein